MDKFKREQESEVEQYPVVPRYHPVNRLARTVYDLLASARLAMILLVIILVCCVIGVTLYRGQKAGEMIFGTLWFNGILVLLIVNVACCFFGRIWKRRVTVISFGMILFHLSFVMIFIGIIYNSLFYFEGVLRLTEGETLRNGELSNYDRVTHGRFFKIAWLKGETSLLKMHTGYKVGGDDKRAAYEVAVGEGNQKKQGIVYITHNLDYKGFKYLPDKEGFSLLIVLHDNLGRELYGAYVPLQSLKQQDNAYLYTTGTKSEQGSFPFPQAPHKPFLAPQITYRPLPEGGPSEIFYTIRALSPEGDRPTEQILAEGKSLVGELFSAGNYRLSIKEVRYWTAMNVRYEPGKPIVLASLWAGLSGMIITTFARMIKSRRK